MFVAKAKLANGDSVRLTLAGTNFMAALAGLAQAVQKSDKMTPEEAAGIQRLTITSEEGGTTIQRRKFRPRQKTGTAGASPSTAGEGPISHPLAHGQKKGGK